MSIRRPPIRGIGEWAIRPRAETERNDEHARDCHTRIHHGRAVRGDLLAKLGRVDEARVAFERAASLTRNMREREIFLARAAALVSGAHGQG